jgi:uncharacterized protein
MSSSDQSDGPRTVVVRGIPVSWVAPPAAGVPHGLALWLPYLGGSKALAEPVLERLAARGFLAFSFDPWQHGDRATESPGQIRGRMLGAFRRELWAVLGQTVLEAMMLIDEVAARHEVPADVVVAGGFSMGGDVAVALAGADHRVRRVASLGSTPNWARPGMRAPDGSGVVDQGEPSAYARWLYERLDPMNNLDHFASGPALLFEGGDADEHVSLDHARRFAEVLSHRFPDAGRNVVVRGTPGLDHIAAVANPEALERCIEWLTAGNRSTPIP